MPKKYLCIPKYLDFFIYIPFLFFKKLQSDYNISKYSKNCNYFAE